MKQQVLLLILIFTLAFQPIAVFAGDKNEKVEQFNKVTHMKEGISLLAEGQSEETSENDENESEEEVSGKPITREELTEGKKVEGLSENRLFAPQSDSETPSQEYEGTLELEGAQMGMSPDFSTKEVQGKDTTLFPDVSIDFFTVDNKHLVPTTQNVIPNGTLEDTESYWDIIVQPGQVWSNPDQDNDWNRASFPFSLVNRIEGETHTGIAMFLYKDDEVSDVRFQIVSQTAPFYVSDYFNAWGVTEASYEPGGLDNLEEHEEKYRSQVENRFPTAPISDLEKEVGADKLAKFDGATNAEEESSVPQTGLFYEGVLYQSPCDFAGGSFPYCDEVRYGVWSVTKSAVMNVAMLRLAEKYGADMLDEKIVDYVSVSESEEDWGDVTILDMANMATGRDGSDADPDYSEWYLAPSKDEKITESLDHPQSWETGTKFNYRDQDAFFLGVVLEEYLRSKEGENTTLDQMLMEEVYEPIGIYSAPANYTIENKNTSEHIIRTDMGYYPTLDDLTKIALLYQKHGNSDGNQILNRELVDSILPQEGVPDLAIPKEGEKNEFGTKYYAMNWHIEPYQTKEDNEIYLPYMGGFGSVKVTLMPGEVIGLRIANSSDPSEEFDSIVSQAQVGEELVSFSEDSEEKSQEKASNLPIFILIGFIIIAGVGVSLLFFRKRKS